MCSVSGVLFSPFFYAFLLIDVVLSFPMLKAILQSVTHNLQQVILNIFKKNFFLAYFNNNDDFGSCLFVHRSCI